MSYTLKLTNGTILLTLADQQSDKVTTSLTLIGKNVNAYGTDLNDNFIHLLENFSNDTEPTSPLVGQLWFDQFSQRIKVYTDSLQFKPVGGPIVSSTQPTGLVAGDMWIDPTKQQLSFYDGQHLVLAGPDYDASLGKSGVIVSTIYDITDTAQTVSKIYSNGTVIGIMSSATFLPRIDEQAALNGITSINPGITLSPNTKLYGTSLNADSISNISVSNLLISNTTSFQTMQSQLLIYNDDGLTVGSNEDVSIYVDTNEIATLSVNNTQDFRLLLRSQNSSTVNCLYFSSSTGYLGIFNNSPTVPVDINGNVRISSTSSSTSSSTGALTVSGGIGVSGDSWVGGNSYSNRSHKPAIGLVLPSLTSAPTGPDLTAGLIVRCDGVLWDPLATASTASYIVWYTGSVWRGLHENANGSNLP